MLWKEYLNCPKCQSKNTKRLFGIGTDWSVSQQQCQDCGHRDHWGSFADPPVDHLFPKGRKRVVIE